MQDDRGLAQSVIDMYGTQAEMVAIEHANMCRKTGATAESARWLRVAELIRARPRLP